MSSAAIVANACETTNWRMDSANEKLMSDGAKCAEQSPINEIVDLGSSGDECSHEQQTSTDNSNKSSEESSESCCHDDSSKFGCGKSSGCGSTNCNGCHCRCSSAQRRCSTSDIKTSKVNEMIFNGNLIKKAPVVGKGEKVDKINLANLVFNPNFKTNGGCVNLPVIRAGQNLAQKNAQRKSTSDLTQLTKEETLDLLAKQLQQPHSLTKTLNDKIKKLTLQHQGNGSSSGYSSEDSSTVDVGDIIQSIAGGKTQLQIPSQNNAARYKTELCRSYQEGGECRFGAACTFAHGPDELRPVPRHPLYKTELCRTYHQHGYCQYGTRCHFIHDADEADKNAPLKGCKTWGRHDQLSGALLSLASSSGILDNESTKHGSSENDVLLANLRRLYALSNHGQEKESASQFSNSQPLGSQLAMAHQQFSSTQPSLPLSMTQPLPMEALQLGLHRANQLGGRGHGHMGSNNRVESIANDYANWGVSAPPSPTYPGISPFNSYQQFSPLPHHGASSGGHPSHQAHHQGYGPPTYPFSATAPDLSAALNVSPYAMSPPTFSNTVNVGHILPDQNGNFPPISSGKASSAHGLNSVHNQQMWPQTSAEVSSAIDRELFGFGLDSQGHAAQQQSQQQQQMSHSSAGNGGYQQFQPAYFPGANQYGSHQQNSGMPAADKYGKRASGAELLNYLNSDKYMSDKQSLKPIREMEDSCGEQGVRPKMRRSISGSNARRSELQTEL